MTTVLRPMSLGELLDRTFFLYRKNFLLFVGIVALPLLVVLAIGLGAVFIGVMSPNQSAWRLASLVLIYPIILFVTAAWWSATVIAVSQLHLERPTGVIAAYSMIKKRVLRVGLIMLGLGIAVSILFVMAIAIAAGIGAAAGAGIGILAGVVLVIPCIIITLRWSLTIPVAVLEGVGLSRSASRSSQLTKGHAFRIFAIAALFLVLTYLVYLLWEIPLLAATGIFNRAGAVPNPNDIPVWTMIAMPIGSFLTQILIGPMLTIALSLVYYDERVRKEAFDLQVMMSSLDTMQAAAAAASGLSA
jgi:glycerophosphoryl diester phosphodiesterase family protein